tara:strand:- start:178 stop:537 length:360 start_codon:yes stop_codon:yes gene_type:complete
MGSLVNFINNFKKDLVSVNDTDECKQFFFKSIMHLMVSLEIASSSILDEKINFSKLKSLIPSSLGTEEKVKEVLNEGIENSFFIEKKFFKKNNQSYYKISKKFSLMITNWYLENKTKFN